jgi:exodeoxyribonuclease VII large subunit
MGRDDEPPDWALPAWDATGPAPRRAPSGGGETGPDAGAGAISGDRIVPGGTFGLTILGVSDVTRAVREAVRSDERLRDVWVEGEVGRVTVSSAGHAYFTLKDERSQLQCVWFRDDRMASPYEPRTGLRVVANGRVDVFDANGVYQLYVSAVQPAGFGDLALRFEALKAQLSAEGLFDAARKRPLPDRPAVIAVVTSETGAVWHDIRNVLARRWPLARVLMSQCQVQGAGAPASIVRALAWVDRFAERRVREGRPGDAPTVTILARGGGSLEDLWSFNDETVVRAIVRHRLPVVCGVGHETDVTLADFAADRRAPTPSAAAEIVVPDRLELAGLVAAETRRLENAVRRTLAGATREAAAERRALDGLSPVAQLATSRERAGLLIDRATRAIDLRLGVGASATERAAAHLRPAIDARLGAARSAVASAGAALGALGPEATLERGYAIVRRRRDGRIVRDPAETGAGEGLAIRLARGEVAATVDSPPGDRR